jgi:hypothetical protein
MDNILMSVKGIYGGIELLQDRIRIKRKGFGSLMLQGFKGDKEILISQLSAIQLKKAGMLTNGYIQFSFLGGHETKGGLLDATRDENTVMFNTKQQKEFIELKERIDQMIASSRAGTKAPSNLDELEKLASLKDKGIITEEEFNLKKKQLLGL